MHYANKEYRIQHIKQIKLKIHFLRSSIITKNIKNEF